MSKLRNFMKRFSAGRMNTSPSWGLSCSEPVRIRPQWLGLEEMDLTWIAVHYSWRLNKHRYDGLQDRNIARPLES
jgi:hypothetical protein